MRIIFAILVLGAMCSKATAQSSKDYAMMAKRSWSAFECAALASTADLKDERERLFHYGYNQGKAFIDATIAGKVEHDDILQIAPWGFTSSLEGPSVDFMLGVVWSAATDNALSDVHKDGKEYVSIALWKMRADTKFRKANCSLL